MEDAMPKKKTVGQTAAKEPSAAMTKTKKARAPKAAARAGITIDYPLEGEIVTSAAYTFRITADEPRSVEVSTDGKTWQPARESVGHWWYDWSGTQSGPCTLVARMKSSGGKSLKSKPRQFTVLI
jgi:hypothetical protein